MTSELSRVQDAAARVRVEVLERMLGREPDDRFDPIIDSLLDLVDRLDRDAAEADATVEELHAL